MLAPDITKSELEQTLCRLANELPPERLAEVIDFAMFVKSSVDRSWGSARTPGQLEALKQLFAGPKHMGLYASLMRERALFTAQVDLGTTCYNTANQPFAEPHVMISDPVSTSI